MGEMMSQTLSRSTVEALTRLRDACRNKSNNIRQTLLARGFTERDIDECDFSQCEIPSQIGVRVILRDRQSTSVKVRLPSSATARDAMEASGLIARDGTPYRCFDSESYVIDELLLSQLIPIRGWKPTATSISEFLDAAIRGENLDEFIIPLCDIFVGIPQEIEAVFIEETTHEGKVGKGHLLDGTTILVPEAEEGEFTWVVVSARHQQMQLATGFKIPYERTSYSVGDIVHVRPGIGCFGGNIFNPLSCKFDLWIQIEVPRNINRADYDGLVWAVRIKGTNPLVGILDTNLTPDSNSQFTHFQPNTWLQQQRILLQKLHRQS